MVWLESSTIYLEALSNVSTLIVVCKACNRKDLLSRINRSFNEQTSMIITIYKAHKQRLLSVILKLLSLKGSEGK
jgi:hypothetical protein